MLDSTRLMISINLHTKKTRNFFTHLIDKNNSIRISHVQQNLNIYLLEEHNKPKIIDSP